MNALLNTSFSDGTRIMGGLFDNPPCCPSGTKCEAFFSSLEEDAKPYDFVKCPYGFAACHVKLCNRTAFICGMNVKGVSPRNKKIDNNLYVPAISVQRALALVKKNIDFIEARQLAERQSRFIPTLVHGLSKVLDGARLKGEWLLQHLGEDVDLAIKDSIASIAIATLAANVVFYSDRVQAQNSLVGSPRALDVFGKFFKMRKLLTNYGRFVRIDFHEEPKFLYALFVSFEAAVFQVLQNSIKYTPNSENIDVYFGETDDGLEIVVSNIGPHISKKELRRIKEFGVRGENAARYTDEGAGIGLSSISNIAEINGISFDIDSDSHCVDIGGIPFSRFVARFFIPKGLKRGKRRDECG